jgi:ubiquinone/menaquinone biosynthesis C-methylase UbiE
LFFTTAHAYQRTAALRTAIALDLFTTIGDGASTAPEIARACGASDRGIRILCNYLTVIGFLVKDGESFRLTPDTSLFLTKRSPAYLGGTLQFLANPGVTNNLSVLTDTVRLGKVSGDGRDTVDEENPVWKEFARAMVPFVMPAAQGIADLLDVASAGPITVLDIAAGHGYYGITLAQRNPQAEIVAVDWPGVLEVAREHAAAAGVGDRIRLCPGNAFTVDWGSGYDVGLVTNFLHHFDVETCTTLLRKVAASLRPGGRVAVLEFVVNDDHVSPPLQAAFAMNMLAGTDAGDVYSYAQIAGMLREAGFGEISSHELPNPQTVIVGKKS